MTPQDEADQITEQFKAELDRIESDHLARMKRIEQLRKLLRAIVVIVFAFPLIEFFLVWLLKRRDKPNPQPIKPEIER